MSVTVHQAKNNVIWGLRMAKNRALLSGRLLSSPLSPPLDEWKRELCGSAECCVSQCSIYLDAIKRKDLIIWTDASFFPDSHKCAAAFGWESDEGLHVTAFRVRGSAARGEALAIFAALSFASQNFSDHDVTIFSDCESAITRVSSLLSLSISGSLYSSISEVMSSMNKRIYELIKQVIQKGQKLRIHWVKAHVSIIQNEMIDAAAKKEALNFRRETLFEEKPQDPGEVTLKGQLVESRQEIEYAEWRPDLDKTVMKVARSYHARKFFAGVQQWRGLKSNWATNVKGDCVYCHDKHSLAFGIFLQKCNRCKEFRARIGRLWSDVTWDNELLEGRVTHKIVSQMTERRAGLKEGAIQEARVRVREWEKIIRALCHELRGKSDES